MAFYRREPKNWCIRCPINNVFLAGVDSGTQWIHSSNRKDALWYGTRKEAQYVLDQVKQQFDFRFRLEEWT